MASDYECFFGLCQTQLNAQADFSVHSACHRHISQGSFVMLTLVLLNPDMSCPCKQCRSRSIGFWTSQLIWICTVCHSVFEFLSTTWIKKYDWLKIRSGHGILICSVWQGLKLPLFFFFYSKYLDIPKVAFWSGSVLFASFQTCFWLVKCIFQVKRWLNVIKTCWLRLWCVATQS